MTQEERIEYLAKAVMTLSELGDGKTACALNEIRLEMKSQLELPDGLEEAADAYSNEHNDDCFDAIGDRCPHILRAFIAGVKWDRAKILEKAVEGRVFMSFAPGHNQMVMADVDLPTNTKVKVVVIKEDEK